MLQPQPGDFSYDGSSSLLIVKVQKQNWNAVPNRGDAKLPHHPLGTSYSRSASNNHNIRREYPRRHLCLNIEVRNIPTTRASDVLPLFQRDIINAVALAAKLSKNLLIQLAILSPAMAHEYANVTLF
ncbi:MAG: hypothetical protein K2P58_07365 [Hyphomonadaceae bacterium]|nr:hypothetical protein [Hyphomonadaceae bacterium]